MKVRDLVLLIIVFSAVLFLGQYFIGEPSTFKKEYILEAAGVGKTFLILLDVPARNVDIYIIPEGHVKIMVDQVSTNGESWERMNRVFLDSERISYEFYESTYLKIMVYLDPGERVSLTLEIKGYRKDLEIIGLYTFIMSTLLYIILYIISWRYRLDWI